jgi:hypothetical protein
MAVAGQLYFYFIYSSKLYKFLYLERTMRVLSILCTLCPLITQLKAKAKAVPLHATNGLGGRGGIAPAHSQPRHWMVVSGQRHAPAAL